MVNAVIKWCLDNPFLVLLFTLVTLGFGWYALTNTPVDAIPDIGEKQVIVYADWPGKSPQPTGMRTAFGSFRTSPPA